MVMIARCFSTFSLIGAVVLDELLEGRPPGNRTASQLVAEKRLPSATVCSSSATIPELRGQFDDDQGVLALLECAQVRQPQIGAEEAPPRHHGELRVAVLVGIT